MANRLTAQRDELALGMGYFAALAAIPPLTVVVGPRVTEEPHRQPTRSLASSQRPCWVWAGAGREAGDRVAG